MFTSASAAAATGIPSFSLILAGAVVVPVLVAMVLRAKQARARGGAPAFLAGAQARSQPVCGMLLSSRPRYDVRATARSAVWSFIVHACVIAALLRATTLTRTITIIDDDPPPITLLRADLLPAPAPPPQPTKIQRGGDRGIGGPIIPTITPLSIVPHVIPPDLGRVIEPEIRSITRQGGGPGVQKGGAPESDPNSARHFIPGEMVRPELKNPAEVERVLLRTYPRLLRDSGIGGTVLLWFLIDEKGKVLKTEVKQSSGHPELDEAATRVAEVMVFRPAINGDRKISVWVAIPIKFDSR